MKIATVTINGVSPYGQSKYYNVEKLKGELHKDYEARTWRERLHSDADGNVFIPPNSLKNALSEAAKYLSMQIPGKGKSTYTKHVEAGVFCLEGITLPAKKTDVEGQWLFVPSDGKRGGGKRVEKCFPVIHKWGGTFEYHVLDDIITEDVMREHIEAMGKFIGLGFFRPRNNGYWGRFTLEKLVWKN